MEFQLNAIVVDTTSTAMKTVLRTSASGVKAGVFVENPNPSQTFADQILNYNLPLEYNAFITGVAEHWHEVWDQAYVYDVRETHGCIQIEWRFGSHRPSIEILPNQRAYFHTCNLDPNPDPNSREDDDAFHFDAGWWPHIYFVTDKLVEIYHKALAGGASDI